MTEGLRTLIIGTTGQLATELRRGSTTGLNIIAAERVDLAAGERLVEQLEQLRPALVLNAGAYTAVDRAETEREKAFLLNASGPALVAKWCKNAGATLIHVSTDYVFDGRKAEAYTEGDQVAPLNVYGESKLAGEVAIREVLQRHIILRTSWVFSAHGQNFVKTMLRLAAEREELRVVGDQTGRPTAAKELARAILVLAQRLSQRETLPWGTYHFANAGATTWHGLATATVDAMAARTGKRPLVTSIPSSAYPTPARRPMNSVLDTGRLEEAFGIHPRPWIDDLHEVIAELTGRTGPATRVP